MKTAAFTFLAWLAIAANVAGQHWAPVRAGHLAHFATNGGTHLADVARTVYTDSLHAVPDTLHLHLNRIVTPCYACPYDTQAGGPQAPNGQWRAALAHQPHFLGRTATALPGGQWWLHGPAAVCIWAEAGLGESWLFDSSASLTATVSGYDTATVLGQPDSLKTLTLSNGGVIQLARSYGLVRWQADTVDYRLVGWENELTGQVLGVKWPRFADVFTAQPGDTVYTRFAEGYGDPGAHTETYSCSIISNVLETADTVFTTISSRWEQYNGNGWGWPPYLNGFSTSMIKTPNTRMPFIDGEIFVFEPAIWYQHQLFSPVFDFLPGGNQLLFCGSFSQDLTMPAITTNPIKYSYVAQFGSDTLRLMDFGFGDGYYTSLFHARCPFNVYNYFSGFEHHRSNELHLNSANLVCGPVGAPDAATAATVRVVTPINGEYFVLQNPTGSLWQATLCDVTGRTLKTYSLPPNAEKREELEAFPSGIYFLRATDGQNAVTQRVWRP